MIAALGGDPLPDLLPDYRQGWVEKWLLLAAEERRAQEEEPSPDGNLAIDDVLRRLGAVERR